MIFNALSPKQKVKGKPLRIEHPGRPDPEQKKKITNDPQEIAAFFNRLRGGEGDGG